MSDFYGKTIIVNVLISDPTSPRVLRDFRLQQIFSLKEPALILNLIGMIQSFEIDSYIKSWREKSQGSNIFSF
jgi:hypothetical protein